MTETSLPPREFLDFLRRIVAGHVDVEDWNRHVIGKYSDDALESARLRLSQDAMSIGQCSARPIPDGIDQLAAELLAELE